MYELMNFEYFIAYVLEYYPLSLRIESEVVTHQSERCLK